MRKKNQILLLLVTLIAANSLIWASTTLARQSDAFKQIGLLMSLRRALVTSHVEIPDQQKMLRAAVRGMIGALGDPYTTFLFPEDMKQFDKQVRGSFSGIGAEVMIDPVLNRVKIVTPLEESPAWKSGIMAGDIILQIDGVDTEGMKITEAVKRLTGQQGTVVKILVRHKTGKEQTISVTRARIKIQTVKGVHRDKNHHWNFMLDEKQGIGYVRLTQFNESTSEDLRKALTWLNAHHAKALILDLRFNPGGLLRSAIEVSDMFLPGGKTIVSVRGRAVQDRTESSTDEATLFTGPVAVIANEASASASEIVTGALCDNGRAQLIGTRTFGKGSVQQLRMLEDNQGALKITNAYYYLPNGEKIHRVKNAKKWGVDPKPGFYVAMHAKQIEQMLKIRRKGDILNQQNGQIRAHVMSPQWILENLKDPQLAAAFKSITGKLQTGQWLKVGAEGGDAIRNAMARENLVRQRTLLIERLEQVNRQIKKLDQLASSTLSLKTSTPGSPDSPGSPGSPANTDPSAAAPGSGEKSATSTTPARTQPATAPTP